MYISSLLLSESSSTLPSWTVYLLLGKAGCARPETRVISGGGTHVQRYKMADAGRLDVAHLQRLHAVARLDEYLVSSQQRCRELLRGVIWRLRIAETQSDFNHCSTLVGATHAAS